MFREMEARAKMEKKIFKTHPSFSIFFWFVQYGFFCKKKYYLKCKMQNIKLFDMHRDCFFCWK